MPDISNNLILRKSQLKGLITKTIIINNNCKIITKKIICFKTKTYKFVVPKNFCNIEMFFKASNGILLICFDYNHKDIYKRTSNEFYIAREGNLNNIPREDRDKVFIAILELNEAYQLLDKKIILSRKKKKYKTSSGYTIYLDPKLFHNYFDANLKKIYINKSELKLSDMVFSDDITIKNINDMTEVFNEILFD